MPKALLKFFSMLGLFAALYYGYSLVRNIFWPAGPLNLGDFFFPHLVFKSLEDLLNFFIPLFLTALVMSFSFWIKPADLPKKLVGGIDGQKTLQIALVPILLALFFNTFLVLGLKPSLHGQIVDWEHRAAEESAILAKLNGLRNKDFLQEKLQFPKPPRREMSPLASLLPTEDKIALVERLVALRPDHSAYQFKLRLLQSQKMAEDFINARRLPLPPDWYLQSFTGLKPADLLKQAAAYLANDDFANANFRAFLAFQMLTNLREQQPGDFAQTDPGLLPEAKRLVDASWTASLALVLTVSEKVRASYFFRKGKSMGDFQFHNYLEAYYGFLELSHENMRDPETEKFLQLSLTELRQRVIFKEELERYFTVPGWKHLVFLKPIEAGAGQGVKELLSIGDAVETSAGVFFKDIQALRFDAAGNVLFQWRAEFGKLENDRLNLEVRSLQMPGDEYLPRLLVAQPGGLASAPLSWPMQVPWADLKVLGPQEAKFDSLNLLQLLQRSEVIGDLGYSTVPLKTEFSARVLNSLFLLVASFFSLFIAWTFRSKYLSYPPRFLQLMLLLLPFVLGFVQEAVIWVLSLVAGLLIQSFDWGFPGVIYLYGGLALPAAVFFIYTSWKVMSR